MSNTTSNFPHPILIAAAKGRGSQLPYVVVNKILREKQVTDMPLKPMHCVIVDW
jgi:hypothetical protein